MDVCRCRVCIEAPSYIHDQSTPLDPVTREDEDTREVKSTLYNTGDS